MPRRRKAGSDTAISSAWRASRGGLSVVVVFSVFINALKFAIPLYLLQVFDRVTASRSIETLVMLTVIALAATASGLALEVVRRRMLTRWGIWIERRFGPRLVHQGLSHSSRRHSVDIDQALRDLSTIRSFLSQSAASWFDVIWAPLFFIGVYIIHPLLGTVAILAVCVLIILAIMQDWITRESRRASSAAYREAEYLVLVAERNKESVGALSMARNLTEKWRRTASGRLVERERIEARSRTIQTLVTGLGEFLRIAMISFGIWLVLGKVLTFGAIYAARVMAGFGYNLIERSVRNWRALREVNTSYRNLKQLLADDDAAEVSVAPGTARAPLVLDMVSFRYSGQRDDVFWRLSLTVEPGEALLVTGTAGTGKTTLSRLLVGFLEPRYGQVRFGDVEIRRLPEDIRAEMIGYLPQHTELFHGTVKENIARMGDGPLDAVVAAAELVGIHDLIVRLPEGYDTQISDDVFGLSGSERKRIALARAFFKQPRLIVLDEPSANLDSPSRRIMEAAVKRLKAEGCSIVVTQGVESNQLSRLMDKFLILGGRTPEFTVAEQEQRSRRFDSKTGLRSVT